MIILMASGRIWQNASVRTMPYGNIENTVEVKSGCREWLLCN